MENGKLLANSKILLLHAIYRENLFRVSFVIIQLCKTLTHTLQQVSRAEQEKKNEKKIVLK